MSPLSEFAERQAFGPHPRHSRPSHSPRGHSLRARRDELTAKHRPDIARPRTRLGRPLEMSDSKREDRSCRTDDDKTGQDGEREYCGPSLNPGRPRGNDTDPHRRRRRGDEKLGTSLNPSLSEEAASCTHATACETRTRPNKSSQRPLPQQRTTTYRRGAVHSRSCHRQSWRLRGNASAPTIEAEPARPPRLKPHNIAVAGLAPSTAVASWSAVSKKGC